VVVEQAPRRACPDLPFGEQDVAVTQQQAIAIPDTLQGSLTARLDQLDAEAREVAPGR
jgi:hypothetical protein